MEEKNTGHFLSLEDRQKLRISAVVDVDTFDEAKIILFTEEDVLTVEGTDLHIQKLDVANGELLIEGDVRSLVYTGKNGSTGSKGILRRLLR